MKKYSYQPPRSAREIKADELTETVRAIVEKEKAELEAKLKRLRLARAERDAAPINAESKTPPATGARKVAARKPRATPSAGDGAAHSKDSARH